MRVLFVDDEQRVLDGIENALIFDGDDLEASFAVSGEQAIAELGTSAFDVIVTDMKMPGLTGADVLEHVREHHPTVARIVLSGEVDPELAQRAMPLTHEFVSKPCDPAELFEIVRTVFGAAHSLESPAVTELVGRMSDLPVQPRVFHEIQAAVADDGGLDEVARIVESDIAIATTVLRTANSAFYGFRHPARSIHDAVSRLGSVAVSGLAVHAAITEAAQPHIVAELERLNALTANVARIVRDLIGEELPQAPLAALLRSIGVVVLQINMTEIYRPIQEHFNQTGEADEAAELRVLGATHAQVGAYVLRMWKVDQLVVEAVEHHRHVDEARDPDAIRIIHAMAAADAALGPGRDIPSWIDQDLVNEARVIVERLQG